MVRGRPPDSNGNRNDTKLTWKHEIRRQKHTQRHFLVSRMKSFSALKEFWQFVAEWGLVGGDRALPHSVTIEKENTKVSTARQRVVTICLIKWFKFNCMNSLKMNWNCNYRMNLQDTECLKFFSRIHVARTTGCQERSSDRATPWSTFITHCLKLSDAQRSMFRSPKRLWNLVWFASSDFKTAHFYS